jgi:hypothetical protein
MKLNLIFMCQLFYKASLLKKIGFKIYFHDKKFILQDNIL